MTSLIYGHAEVPHDCFAVLPADSFEKLQRYERRDLGEYRTARLVLDAYDRMAAATVSGGGWSSSLTPGPGDGPRHP